MSNPALCFRNHIEYFDPADKAPGTLAATSEESNYPVENVATWRIGSEDRWKATSNVYQIITIDFGAGVTPQPDTYIIAGHNTSGDSADSTHQLWYSDVGVGGPWTSAASSDKPTTDGPFMKTFTVGAGHRYWAIDFQATASTAVELGQWFLGNRLDFPVGLQPGIDYFSATPALYNDSPLNGSNIGRAVSHLNKSIRLDWQSPGFPSVAQGDFFPYSSTPDYDDVFLQHLSDGTPFWFSPDNDNHPTHLYMCHADGFSTPFDGSMLRRTFSGTITGFSEVL